jgi:signal peptidase II
MVLAGAVGNLIDCMFYGLMFNESSPYYVSYFVPFGTGYAPFLMGKVVDMFYFPLIETEWPMWMPFVGGDYFVFFSPVFNFADASISVSVVLLILFYREEIGKISMQEDKPKTEEQAS